MSSDLASVVLNHLRRCFGVIITEAGIGDLTILEARHPGTGERWQVQVEGGDDYAAACRLAELMGLELDDG
jgi:hypothetical protein